MSALAEGRAKLKSRALAFFMTGDDVLMQQCQSIISNGGLLLLHVLASSTSAPS